MTQLPTKEKSETFARRDIHQQVTDTIIKQLEGGTIPWQQPWKGTGSNTPFQIPRNISSGKHYRGVNILLLWSAAIANDYPSNEWATLKQWNAINESVSAKQKGTMITKFDVKEVEDKNKEIKKIAFLKHFYVFNKCQLANYKPEEKQETSSELLVEKVAVLDDFIQNAKVEIEHHNGGALYSVSKDKIFMPFPEMFIDTKTATATEGYYSSLTHELGHSTSHPSRLNRENGKRFGDMTYAKEELTAEFIAAFLCSEFGIARPEKEDHAAYIASWLKVLKDNKNNLISAASAASKAVDYLHSLQP